MDTLAPRLHQEYLDYEEQHSARYNCFSIVYTHGQAQASLSALEKEIALIKPLVAALRTDSREVSAKRLERQWVLHVQLPEEEPAQLATVAQVWADEMKEELKQEAVKLAQQEDPGQLVRPFKRPAWKELRCGKRQFRIATREAGQIFAVVDHTVKALQADLASTCEEHPSLSCGRNGWDHAFTVFHSPYGIDATVRASLTTLGFTGVDTVPGPDPYEDCKRCWRL